MTQMCVCVCAIVCKIEQRNLELWNYGRESGYVFSIGTK